MKNFKVFYVSFLTLIFVSSLLISCSSKEKKEYQSSLKEIKTIYKDYYDGKPISTVNSSNAGQYKPLIELENKFVTECQGTDILIKNKIQKLKKFNFTNFNKNSLKKYKEDIDTLKKSYKSDLEKLEKKQMELQSEVDKSSLPQYGKDYYLKIAKDRTYLQIEFLKKRKTFIEAYIKNLEEIYSFMNNFSEKAHKKGFDINVEIDRLDKLNSESDRIVKESDKLESELKNKILKLLS